MKYSGIISIGRKICGCLILINLCLSLKAQIQPSKTIILILENRSYSQIVGNPQAPYINALLTDVHTAVMTQSYGLTHPSQPNYIMLFSGSRQGVTTNNLPAPLPFTTPNLGAAMAQAGFSFTGYSESLPFTGYTGETSGSYARKHNPWVNWQGTGTNGIPSNSNRPFTDFPSDFNQLPTLSFVVPNQDNDMHDGTIAAGDLWVQTHMNACIQWCKQNNGLFILTFDEDDGSSNNRILTTFTGSDINGGNYNQPITHYNLLRTIEALYHLPYAGASNDSTPVRNIWLTPLPVQLLNLTGTVFPKSVLIKWETAQETQSREFQLERSTDQGQSWLKLHTISAAGSSFEKKQYQFTDEHPVIGMNYYRLKQVDQNNAFTYSRTIVVQIKQSSEYYSLFPNPIIKGELLIRTYQNRKLQILIFDLAGRKVFAYEGLTTNLLNLSFLRKGIYMVRIDDGRHQEVKKLMIE